MSGWVGYIALVGMAFFGAAVGAYLSGGRS